MLLAPEPYPRAEVGGSGDEFQEVRDRKLIRLYFLHWSSGPNWGQNLYPYYQGVLLKHVQTGHHRSLLSKQI